MNTGAAANALACLFDYPGDGFTAYLDRALVLVHSSWLEEFSNAMLALAPDTREELHAATFEVTPACVPYAGIHLFGEENFKRGEFMAALFARYQETGFDCGGELPDHVANLLRYLGRCEADEQRELAEFCLLGPLEKMIGALNDHNPYRLLLLSVSDWLMQEFPDALAVPMPGRSPGAAAIGCGGCSCDTTTTPQSPSTPPILHDQEILTGSHYD